MNNLKLIFATGKLLLIFNFLFGQQSSINYFMPLKDSITFYSTRKITRADSLAKIYLDYAIQHGNKVDVADALLTQGEIQNSLYQFEQARENIIESLKYYEGFHDTLGIIKAKLALGMNHNFLNEFDHSIELSREVIKICEANGDSDLLFQGYYSMGRALGWSQYGRNNIDTLNLAISFFKKAQQHITTNYDSLYYLPLFRGFGDAYYKLGNYTEALKYFEMNLRQQLFHKSNGGIINSAYNLGIIYKELGNPDKSIFYLKLGEQYADNLNYAGLHTLYFEIYTYYLLKSDFKNALDYYQKYVEVNDKKLIADKNGAVSRLTMLYQTEKQESQIKDQQADIQIMELEVKNQKVIIFLSFISLSVFIFASYSYYRLYKKNKASSEKNVLLLKEQNHRVKNNL